MGVAEAVKTKNNPILSGFFVILTAAAHMIGYDYTFSLFGLHVYIFLPMMAFMAILGPLAFLVQPRFARMKILWRRLLILLVPVLLPALWSHITWIINQVEPAEIRRGYVSIIYMAAVYCAAASFVYVAGEEGGLLYLISMLLANFMKMLLVIADGGIGPFLAQFIRLLVTLTRDTGPLMAQMELQGVTFGLGIYLLWFLLDRTRIRKSFPMFLATAFFFILGLKRMALLSLIPALLLCLILSPRSRADRVRRFLLRGFGILFIIAIVAFVGMVYYGLFDILENMGIDTNGRAMIYERYIPYMEFSPSFLGKGAGWVENMIQIWQPELEKRFELSFHTHNEYLRIYLELGMIGFVCWCLSRFHFLMAAADRMLDRKGARICLAALIYLGVNYMMDMIGMNPSANVPLAVIFLSWGLAQSEERMTAETEQRNMLRSEYGR